MSWESTIIDATIKRQPHIWSWRSWLLLISHFISYTTGQKLKLKNANLQKLIQNLTDIRQLYLDGISITYQGHEWNNALLPLHDLQELSISYSDFSGPLDYFLIRLENRSVIILDGNNFSSPIPETFSNLKNLTTLSLTHCGFHCSSLEVFS
jgi:hypothetical protein